MTRFTTIIILLLVSISSPAEPLGTAFTYQGQLSQSETPANANFDFQFALFDSDDFVTGIQLESTVTIQDHPVVDGLFNVEIDFGSNVFGTSTVWLEIRVREGASVGPFTTLAPRNKITAVPVAIHAMNVDTGAIGSDQLASGAVGSDQIADASIVGSDVNPDEIQLRINSGCAPDSAIRVVNSDGAVICDPDSDTVYVAGFGLLLQGSSFSADPGTLQRRVSGTCPAEQFMVGINADGSVQCSALPVDCSIELVCPTPTVGKSCVSGRISDALTGMSLEASTLPGEICGSGALGGACDLTLEVHDALAFSANPASSVPLAHAGLLVDGCGRFQFSDVTPPETGLVGVTVDDSGSDNELSAHFAPLVANGTVEQLDALSVRVSTVQLWTTTAGSPFGATTFAERGVVLGTFRKDGVPVQGTKITANGSVQAASDFYFSDADSKTRSTVNDAQVSTGNNGSALIVDTDLVNHSGIGGESGGCTWSQGLTDAIPSVVTVAEFSCD